MLRVRGRERGEREKQKQQVGPHSRRHPGPSTTPLPTQPPPPLHLHQSPPSHLANHGLVVVLTLFVLSLLSSVGGEPTPGSEETTTTSPPPQIDVTHSTDVTALAETQAILNCRVHNINNKTVSWIRHRDIHLLTVGRYTYTSDQRFRALHEEDSDDWILRISYVQPRDTGMYECQVSTTPPISHFIQLKVVKPHTSILGGPDMYLNRGSTINLTCVVEFSPEPPDYVYWNHNNQLISYDSSRGGVTVILEKGDLTTSSLLIQKARPSDSGRYHCSPSNAAPANITLHVLKEHPQAMQHGGHDTLTSSSRGTVLALLLILAALHVFRF